MKDILKNLYKKFPFLDSVISLIFGAIISYLFQNLIDVWRKDEAVKEKVIGSVLFLVSIIVMSVYYKFFYSTNK